MTWPHVVTKSHDPRIPFWRSWFRDYDSSSRYFTATLDSYETGHWFVTVVVMISLVTSSQDPLTCPARTKEVEEITTIVMLVGCWPDLGPETWGKGWLLPNATNLVCKGHSPISPPTMRDWDEEITLRERESRRGKTAITSQEDQDGESWVFVVQAIYLTMTNTIIESEITDITCNILGVACDTLWVRVESEIRAVPHVACYELANTGSWVIQVQ